MDTTIELHEKLSRLQWLMHRQHMKTYSAVGPMAAATRGQGRILALLRIKDGVSTRDLSFLLGIRVSSLNELLAKLEKGGYIVREPSEDDKRVMLIRLTQKGRDEDGAEQTPDGAFAAFTGEELKAFGQYIDRVITALEAELGTDDERGDMHERMRHAREHMGAQHFGAPGDMRGGPCGHGRFGGGPHGFGRGGHGCPHGFDHERRGGACGHGHERNDDNGEHNV